MLVFAQTAWPSGRDEIIQAFSRTFAVNSVLDEVLMIKVPLQTMNPLSKNSESKDLVVFFQSEGHFEIYYYVVERSPKQNNLNSLFKPLFMVSPIETPFEKLGWNEKMIVGLTVDEAARKKSTKWTSHLVPELKKWISGRDSVPVSCRKAVSKAGNLLN